MPDKPRSICPLCDKPTGGQQKFLICQTCYLSPIHLIAKSEGLLMIPAGKDEPKYVTELLRRIQ